MGKTRKDKIRYDLTREKVDTIPIGDKLRKNRQRWLDHTQPWHVDAPVRKIDKFIISRKARERVRTKIDIDGCSQRIW